MADTPQEIIARVKQRNYEARTQYEPDILWLIEQAEKATATPPADAALADELLRLAGAFDMSLNNAASVSMNRRAADSLRKTLMQAAAALRALAVPDELPLFDAAIAVELPCVSVVPYNSKEICTWFAKNVRERMLAASKAGG